MVTIFRLHIQTL